MPQEIRLRELPMTEVAETPHYYAITITEATLLSADEARAARDNIPPVNEYWWLRSTRENEYWWLHSPKDMRPFVACVLPGDGVMIDSMTVRNTQLGVRPVLKFDSNCSNLPIGAVVLYKNLTWTHIAEGILLCDSIICKQPFRKDGEAEDSNIYESSDVKKYIEEQFGRDIEAHLVPVNFDFTGITLLGIEEYEAAKDHIPPLDEWWWLRSPGHNSMEATCIPKSSIINFDNYWAVDVVNGIGYTTVNLDLGVRPVLRFNRKSIELPIGAKVQFKGFTWTHVSEGLLLCDSIIAHRSFREDWRAKDANVYEASDVKRYIEEQYQTWEENKS